MLAVFAEDGIRFQYPESWELAREENEGGWTVTLQSKGTAFLMVTLDRTMPEPEEMANTALEAMQGEYEGLESEESWDTFAGQRSYGHEMRFFSFDLTNTCWTRSFHTEQGTVLIFWESNDLELEAIEPVLYAILKSIVVDVD
jgi:hypothetical protein